MRGESVQVSHTHVMRRELKKRLTLAMCLKKMMKDLMKGIIIETPHDFLSLSEMDLGHVKNKTISQVF